MPLMKEECDQIALLLQYTNRRSLRVEEVMEILERWTIPFSGAIELEPECEHCEIETEDEDEV